MCFKLFIQLSFRPKERFFQSTQSQTENIDVQQQQQQQQHHISVINPNVESVGGNNGGGGVNTKNENMMISPKSEVL